MMSYEASRPDATTTSAGSGNGYHCGTGCSPLPDAPPGVVLEETLACSVPDRIPWFNVDPVEVEQTCDAIGGRICTRTEWQTACQATASCTWGYDPRTGGACTSTWTPTKQCNLKLLDFDTGIAGDQDGLLTTAHTLPTYNQPNDPIRCFADWGGLQGNPAQNFATPYYTCTNSICNAIFDITGNLREITESTQSVYPLMGGAFNSVESGATCTFGFYTVEPTSSCTTPASAAASAPIRRCSRAPAECLFFWPPPLDPDLRGAVVGARTERTGHNLSEAPRRGGGRGAPAADSGPAGAASGILGARDDSRR